MSEKEKAIKIEQASKDFKKRTGGKKWGKFTIEHRKYVARTVGKAHNLNPLFFEKLMVREYFSP